MTIRYSQSMQSFTYSLKLNPCRTKTSSTLISKISAGRESQPSYSQGMGTLKTRKSDFKCERTLKVLHSVTENPSRQVKLTGHAGSCSFDTGEGTLV